jgi:hypothetical protein
MQFLTPLLVLLFETLCISALTLHPIHTKWKSSFENIIKVS